MMQEELALDGNDSRAPRWTREVPAATREKFHVLVIGAGMSGLLQALRLKEAGIPFTVVEKNDSVGGTWYENQYPGCRVDIANHFYSYSFEPYPWTEYFSRRDELLEYFRHFVKRHGLEDHIRYNTEVTAAKYDEKNSVWDVELKSNTGGAPRTMRVNALVSAVGQLNRPRIPPIEGREKFQGVQVHSAEWDPKLDLTGKRVAVVGSGASAFQLVPEVAKIAAKLYVFQRSAPWMLPNPLYHEAVSTQFRWLVQHVPYYARWFRFLIFYPGSDGILPAIRIDKDYPHPERAVNALNDQYRANLVEYMKYQVNGNMELLEKVTPKFPFMGKRMLQDNGSWLRALQQPNVELISEGVTRIDADGIIASNGALRCGCHRLCYRLPRDQVPVAGGCDRQGRQAPRQGVG